MFLAATAVQAQITIGGNVYGGGNAGNLGGSTNVKIYAGEVKGSVFGGARQADIAGCTYVNIDGAKMSGNIIINKVYGGNDVSGVIGSLEAIGSTEDKPDDRLGAGDHHSTGSEEQHDDDGTLKNVSTFILTTPERIVTTGTGTDAVTTQPYHIFVAQLFGSGNGDYTYTVNAEDALKWDVKVGDETIRKIDKPEAARTYVDLHGGTFGYAYAGGHNASVTTAANICVNNTSTPWKLAGPDGEVGTDDDVISDAELQRMGINTHYFDQSGTYNFSRVFGGNNKAEMKIRPSWHLANGSIENLYSGGDEGAMTSPEGILLILNPSEGDNLKVKNVFAGCRKAPVTPKSISSGEPVIPETVEGYKFPRGLAARVLVYGGDITNVYGGNDITGKVTGGSAIGIYSSIKGCVYGGGNGSYAYTDNPALKDSPLYGDFYYNVDSLLNKSEGWFDGLSDTDENPQKSFKSAEALNLFRPNAEQVSLRIAGTNPDKPVIIGGAVYIGGNSATLKPVKTNYMIELKVGSHVIADSVFLANNGASMVTRDILSRYKSTVKDVDDNDQKYSQMNFLSVVPDATDMDETDHGKNTFAKYMDGVVLEAGPQVVFDKEPQDPATYQDYSTKFGSLYCGGNVGSMRNNATTTINVDYKVVIFEKLVGGSNKAYVPPIPVDDNDLSKGYLNVQYRGGLLGKPPVEGDNKGVKVMLNLTGVKIQPMRWKDKDDKAKGLEWNTYVGNEKNLYTTDATSLTPTEGNSVEASANDMNRRFKGGNIYGGCYESGHVNGGVVININGTMVDREGEFGVFDTVAEDTLGEAILYGHDTFKILKRRSGVILDEQGMDVLGTALNVFGGGYGEESEIWGSTTINLNKGYIFQIFGGSEKGVIGKAREDFGEDPESDDYEFRISDTKVKHFAYDDKYSTTINVHGGPKGASKQADRSDDLAEAEFIYGGGFEGPIIGNTRINLGNGRVFNTFAGSCNADILGYTETYIGQWKDKNGNTVTGFPWVRDYTYGGNDLGGVIMRKKPFDKTEVKEATLSKMYTYKAPKDAVGEEGEEGYVAADPGDESIVTANAYTVYKQGRVGGIFGGCYGDYDYVDKYATRVDGKLPYMHNAFVNVSPLADSEENKGNYLGEVYGAGHGHAGERRGDQMQDRSYVLIDIPDATYKFKDALVFGAGAYNGLGMKTPVALGSGDESALNAASAVIDLISGRISSVFGGSYQEGVTRRTVVNVPKQSTIKIDNIFGGAYGTLILPPCDVIESNVNYRTLDNNARVFGAIYGGNNNERRTLYTNVNIYSPVWSDKENGYLATVYGAGRGADTWAEYTNVNLTGDEDGKARVYQVFGGGEMGHVLNAESVQEYMKTYYDLQKPSLDIAKKNPKWSQPERWTGDVGTSELKTEDLKTEWLADWKAAWTLGAYYEPDYTDDKPFSDYIEDGVPHFQNLNPRPELNDETAKLLGNTGKKYNTNVIINEGALVEGYAYGGGLGSDAIDLSGDVYATTYIALLGGTVKKDIYAAGTTGAVYDLFQAKNFTACANAYIEGGTVRNVYGGGWKGNVGYHAGTNVSAVAGAYTDDVLGATHVVIGKKGTVNFLNGDPAILRNAYGGGEGGAVFGTANLTMFNGHIGYIHLNDGECQDEKGNIVAGTRPKEYDEKVNDETYFDSDNGSWLGKNSLYDSGCVFGGGYIDNSSVDVTNVTMYGGQVRNSLFGGGEIAAIGRAVMNDGTPTIYKAGKANVTLYEGNVDRNVFGGGRGYNNLGKHGSLDCDGFIFGQTEVRIYGGEIGTSTGMASGYGNVFGGGDVGYVYSAYEDDDGLLHVGVKDGERYKTKYEGYYYDYKVSSIAFTLEGFEIDENDPNWVTKGEGDNKEFFLTEDCKVLIEPHAKVKTATTVNGHPYAVGDYVLTTDLNTLKPKNDYDETTGKGDKLIWDCLDPTGIIIHNAVFAGGNTSSGSSSSTAHANTPSVFGNATASIHDVYHRDLITLGTGHTGGLYGDGNLTLVDGYRELNITNYGTDYYTIAKEITISEYDNLPDREAAYYELKYTCLKECKDKDGNDYWPQNEEHSKASTITADDLVTQFLELKKVNGVDTYVSVVDGTTPILVYNTTEGIWEPNPNNKDPYWEKSGVLPVYAGRLMNSIQRADFCGVFGSRMVMQGAQDRVPEIVDYTNYTINRVREVSLNQVHSKISDDLTLNDDAEPAAKPEDQDPDDFKYLDKAIHGNYFGIYNIVNFLGALTSDVHFKPGTIAEGGEDKRRTDNTDTNTYGPEIEKDAEGKPIYLDSSTNKKPKYVGDDLTYYQWKYKHRNDRTRNNGTSFNKVALASGVYLELTSEKSTGKELNEKDWGYITGVIELDLINVQTGLGGGFVYAKNEHRIGRSSGLTQTTLTDLNDGAITRKSFIYDGAAIQIETSGNFVHGTQTIIDDCYNVSGKYEGADAVPAHYWYIKGSVYVYDQYISAYTGAPNAYSETVDIPLTITAAAHGTMKLLDVKPNLYAYYSSPGVVLGENKKLTINEVNYYQNDPISYWNWYLLSAYEKNLFVPETMVSVKSYKTSTADNAEVFESGIVKLPDDYTTFKNGLATQTNDLGEGETETVEHALYDVVAGKWVPVDEIYRSSNNLSHDTGYILTYKVNNPTKWDTWYTEFRDGSNTQNTSREKSLDKSSLAEEKDNNDVLVGPNNGPTYRLIDERLTDSDGAVLGQRQYKLGDLISQDVETTYQAMGTHKPTTNQATFKPAYIVTKPIVTDNGVLNVGYAMSSTEVLDANQQVKAIYAGSVDNAYVCTSTIQLSKTEFIYLNSKMTASEKSGYITNVNSQMNEISAGSGNLTSVSAIKAITGLTSEQTNTLLSLFALKQDINDNIQPAYYCTTEITESNKNLYGGRFYEKGVNYRGLEAWSSMSAADRESFIFNYDALDLLIDPYYSKNEAGTATLYAEGRKYQYDGATYNSTTDKIEPFTTSGQAESNPAGYSIVKPVDYTATYNETSLTGFSGTVTVKHENGTSEPVSTIVKGDELMREEYEKLPNEQRHYTGILVKDGKAVTGGYEVYIIKEPFQIGPTPYAVGAIIDSKIYTSLSPEDRTAYVTVLTFAEADKEKTYYYCREKYTQGAPVTPVSSDVVGGAGGGVSGGEVLVGTIIASGTGSGQYGSLPNMQKDFIIHGIAPTETSTLFVSRESDIYNLSKEKIITVVYQYDYEESDVNGNVVPVSERHVVNIHINFKSGVPSVEDIKAPQIVLPGSKVGLRDPIVTPGAYEVTGGGWELFRTATDAESHINGVEYTPATDLLYYYQNDYYVAYYAKTYLGKTYSNHVPVRVANYHDLKKVMEATTHHYYIDHQDVDRDPKIYINNYSNDAAGSKSGLDLLKQLFDLSLQEGKVSTDANGFIDKELDDEGHVTATDSPFKGHKPLKKSMVGGCDNLELIMRTNLEYDSEDAWESIASGTDECFSGVLHGDGYYISGLNNSLFDKLCGQVYNLGVTGSFSDAGIAKTGTGYVENCWMSTSSKAVKIGKPVFGNPTRGGTDLKQVVNCYYQEEASGVTNPYTNTVDASHGNATRMSAQSFYNGEVAYDLNGFYLNKRYYQGSGLNTGKPYDYLSVGTDGTLPDAVTTGYYPADYACYPLDAAVGKYGYVENRFADGDYIYASGTIPEVPDMRMRTKKETINGKETDVTYYVPIWPDDYLFFGQALNYGHVETRTHQDVPSHIAKSSDRIDTDVTGNRVYRAPAYFRSSTMGVAYFNPYAVFAATKKGSPAVKAYENMTAIDFTGYNDVNYAYQPGWQQWSETSQKLQSTGKSTAEYAFYPPLLDDGGVKDFKNADLTKNLLVYTTKVTGEEHVNDACNVTDGTINAALIETAYKEGDATGTGYVAGKAEYRTVAYSDPQYTMGHWVQKSGADYKAIRDHQLVDKQDFNAPMAYTFDTGKRMWYQRQPDNFAGQKHDMDENGKPQFDLNAGWESISLPFSAELVTTDVKGEITHFYNGTNADESTNNKGHEYWLREFTGKVPKDKQESTDPDVYVAQFNYPTAVTTDATDDDKTVYNTFLWDYYYKAIGGHNQQDKNYDTYQKYYDASRPYKDYPLLTKGKPYIIGFPGAMYYEFDLSGGFIAYETTAKYKEKLPEQLDKQTITFASNPGAVIAVSDNEMNAVTTETTGEYRFYPNYLNIEMPVGGYVMSYDGDAYKQMEATDVTEKKNKVSAFRTYFSTATTPQRAARRIVFGGSASSLGDGGRQMSDDLTENLIIDALHGKIVVTSALRQDTDIRIFNVSGQTVDAYTLQPEQVVTTPISVSGIYIVRTADGKYLKKLFVKK